MNIMNAVLILGLSFCLGVPVLVGLAWVILGKSMSKYG